MSFFGKLFGKLKKDVASQEHEEHVKSLSTPDSTQKSVEKDLSKAETYLEKGKPPSDTKVYDRKGIRCSNCGKEIDPIEFDQHYFMCIGGPSSGISQQKEGKDWEKAKSLNTIEAYLEYLEKCPAGRFVEKAEIEIRRIENMGWEKAKSLNTVAAYQEYLEQYLPARFKKEAEAEIRRIENMDWEKTKSLNTVEAYQEYLKQHPAGKFNKQAKDKIENIIWEKSKSLNTVKAYQEYLKQYPAGKFNKQAKDKIHKDTITNNKSNFDSLSINRKTDDPLLERIVRKLVSRDDATFGDGLTEVLAIPESNPLRIRAIREAIRCRSGKSNIRFYETNVGGLTVRDGTEILKVRDNILQLAEKNSLLEDPQISGNLVAAFTSYYGFDAVVNLAYEIRGVAGLDQCQAFQLLYNQNRSYGRLRMLCGEKTWTQQMTATSNTKVRAGEGIKSKGTSGKFSKEAKEEIIKAEDWSNLIDWEKAKSLNTIAAYQEYLKQYPIGKFSNEAKDKIHKAYMGKIF